ncbi:MAG: AmmeMemoRadiSam system protein B [Bifidobacteriaceae bacterium]|jgi:AmmeMemoRadiSam system protein B|nr:AmmeMemoRadiSam system protein B [Bifidobacteriaceae bacterium]
MALVREPAVAGLFYPGAADRLEAQVTELLEAASKAGTPSGAAPKALIAPHAGYQYSGQTAAAAYAALAGGRYDRVVLAGPCHRVGTPFTALAGASGFRTPLGVVPVWEEGAARAAALPQVVTSPEVHALEHSLEVHLPFIQVALGRDTPVLPLAVGWSEPSDVAEVLDTLWGGPETLVVVSSDLSHYQPYAEAVPTDLVTAGQIIACGPPLTGDQACGAHPINGLLKVAVRRGLSGHLIDYRNSGDTAGDESSVVGYAAIAFEEETE